MSSNSSNGGGNNNNNNHGGIGSNTMYIIAGAAAGGFMAALIALLLLAIRRRSLPASNPVTQQQPIDSKNHHTQSIAATNKLGISTEILLRDEDVEVSTLGDPVLQQNGMMTGAADDADEQTASIENDYDYAKQYLRSQGIASISSCDRISSDNSLELATQYGNGSLVSNLRNTQESYEVSVPPGKLGMVIDSPNGGIPVVHAIKADSVLADQVGVGDRLIIVDGDDVTAMTAMQVSKLISLKADQTRILIFLRSRDVELGEPPEIT